MSNPDRISRGQHAAGGHGRPLVEVNTRTRFAPLTSLPLPPSVQASQQWLQCARDLVAERLGQARSARGGMLAVGVGARDASLGFAERGKRRSLAVGRHSHCQVRVHEGQGDMPLRQVLLWNDGTRRAPGIRVLDLRGQLTTHVVGFGPVASAYLEGPSALWLGHCHLFVAHVARGERFVDALPAEMPVMQPVDARRPGRDASGVRRLADEYTGGPTRVTPLLPPIGTSEKILLPDERPVLELRIRAESFGPLDLALGRAALERGVLLGRYPRCEGGKGLPDGVSRVHLALMLHAGRPVAIDLGSTSGTWVGDDDVPHCALVPGRRISLAGAAEVEVVRSEVGR